MSKISNTNILSDFKALYESKKYDEAIDLVTENRPLFEPGVYEFNLGTLFLAKKDFVKARINFEKSKDLGFRSNICQKTPLLGTY